MAFKPRLEVLPPAQQNFWREHPNIPYHFVLYGGTAIALRLGHRSSEDFDFFSSEQFAVASLLDALSFSRDAEILQAAANTVSLRIDPQWSGETLFLRRAKLWPRERSRSLGRTGF